MASSSNTTGARLSGNTVTNNSAGIALTLTTGAAAAGNTATNNGAFGMMLVDFGQQPHRWQQVNRQRHSWIFK